MTTYSRPIDPAYRWECDDPNCLDWGVVDGKTGRMDARREARKHTDETGHSTAVLQIIAWYEALGDD